MLRAINLSIARGGVPLLHGMSFSVSHGEALLVRGANGIGKTSLLRCISGLQAPKSGSIELSQTLAYAGHLDGIKGSLSVMENLQFWSHICGGSNPNLALETYNLSDFAQRPAANLSAGQKRRLGLARLLVSGAKLWVLDEPTVSLDAKNVLLFLRVLKDHLDGGGAAVLSSHIDLNIKMKAIDLIKFKALKSDWDYEFMELLE